MDEEDLVPLDYDPFEGEAAPVASAPTQELTPLDYDPFAEEGDPVVEIPKAVAAGAVNTIAQGARGTAAGRADYMDKRRQELARRKALEEAGYSGNNIDLPPEEQAKVKEIATKATEGAATTGIEDIKNDPFYQAGEGMQKWSDEQFKAAKDYEDSWTRTIGEGLGSTLPFMAASFVPGVGIVLGSAGGMQVSAGEALDRAVKQGATREQVMEAVKLGSLPGLTDQASVEALFAKVPLPMIGKFAGVIAKILGKAAVEGGQEGVQQAAQNIIEKYTYNPEQDISEGVLESAAIGAVVGGVIAGPVEVTEGVLGDHSAADPATPPGVEATDTVGSPTPGGPAATTAAPPAGATPTTAAPKKGRVRKKADIVEVVTPGNVPSDVVAATSAPGTSPDQVSAAPAVEVPGAEPSPELATTPPELVAPPTPQAPVSQTEPGTVQPTTAPVPTAVAPTDDIIDEEEIPDDYDEDEEDVLSAIRGEGATVAPAGADVEAALGARADAAPTQAEQPAPARGMGEPPATEGARYRQPVQEQPAVEGVSQFAPQEPVVPQVPTGEVSSAPVGPVLEQTPTMPETVAQEPVPVQAPANEVIPEQPQEPVQSVSPVEAVEPDLVPLEEGAVVLDEQAPVLNLVGRHLAETVRAQLATDTISETPGFIDMVDQVAAELTQDMQRGQAPAQVVRNLQDLAAETVRANLEAQAQELTTRQAVQEEAKQTRAVQVAEETTVRRAGKVKGKAKEEVATESDRAFDNRAAAHSVRPDGDEDLKAYHSVRQARANIKGRGAGPAKLREPYTKKMAEIRKAYTERQKPKEKVIPAAVKQQEYTPEQKAKIAAADKQAEAVGRIDRSIERNKKVQPAVESAVKEHGPMTERMLVNKEKATEYVSSLVERVSAAVKATGEKIGNVIDPIHNSMHENLAIYGKKLLKGRVGPQGMLEFYTAKMFADAGDRTEFYGTLGVQDNGPRNREVGETDIFTNAEGETSFGKEAGGRKTSVRFEAMQSDQDTGPVGTGEDQFPRMGLSDTYEVKMNDGTSWHVVSRLNTTGQKALDYVSKYAPRGMPGVIHRTFMKYLRDVVGDVKIMFITPETMQGLFPGEARARGLAMTPTPAMYQEGEQQRVFIDDNEFNMRNNDKERAHLIIHELTHAATAWAMNTNYRGTGDIVKTLMEQLEFQLSRDLKFVDELPFQQRYGFTNIHEFVAQAFSSEEMQDLLRQYKVPPGIAKKLGAYTSDRAPTYWEAFKQMVSNAVGLSMFRKRGMDYLEAILSVAPDLMMSEAEQAQRSREHFTDRNVALHGDYSLSAGAAGPQAMTVNAMPDSQFDTAPLMRNAEDRTRAAANVILNPLAHGARWLGAKLATTEELKRRSARYFGGAVNAFTKLADLHLSRQSRIKAAQEEGNKITSALMQYKVKDPAGSEALSDVLHDATRAEVDPSQPLSSDSNKHISKKGRRDNHRRVAHRNLKEKFDALPQEAKDLFTDITDHYADMHNKRIELVVRNVLEAAIEKNGVTLPAGVTPEQAIEWVIGGKIDKKEENRDQFDIDMHTALKDTGKTLKGTREMRRIKGVYVPLTRWGKNFFTARQKLAVPAGATLDPTAKDGNVFIFTNTKDLDRYTGSTEDQVESVVSRWYNPSTGERTTKQNVVADAAGVTHVPVNRIYVTVQNKIMEMDDSINALEKRAAEYEALGYSMSKIDMIENQMHSSSEVLPTHIRRLLKSIDQGSDSEVNKKAAHAAVVNGYIKQMAGSRAQHRQLKRANVQGFSRDLVHSTWTNNNVMAAHLVNLQRTKEIAAAEAELEKYMDDQRYDNAGHKYDALRRTTMARELKVRMDADNRRSETQFGNRAINTAMEMSFMTHLASPAYTITNLTQPFATTLPVLASEHGEMATFGAMFRAMHDMGALTTIWSGITETGREMKAFFPKMPRLDPRSYHKRIMATLKDNKTNIPNVGLKVKLVEELARLGFGTDSGIDSPELSEIGRGKLAISTHRAARIARAMPEAAEAINRYMTGFAALDLAVRSGMDPDAAVNYAVTTVEKTQGGYSVANNPAFMQNRFLRFPLQFKKYGLMYAQLYYGNLAKAMNNNLTGKERIAAGKQIAYLTASTTLMAGVTGIPLMELGKLGVLAASLLVGDGDWDESEKAMQAWFQSMLEFALGKGESPKKIAEMIMHGSPRGIGVDMSSRLGNDSLITFGDPKKLDEAGVKSWVLDMLMGAPGGMVADTLKGINSGDWQKALPLPKFMKDAMKAYDQSTEPRRTKAGKEIAPELGWAETMLMGVTGLTPASVSRRYEYGGSQATYKAKQAGLQERQKMMGQWLNAKPAERGKIFNKIIRPWNNGKSKSEKIEYGDLTRTLTRRKNDARKDAREKARSQ